jgi:thiol-disulfide isomerase/thioredoxin
MVQAMKTDHRSRLRLHAVAAAFMLLAACGTSAPSDDGNIPKKVGAAAQPVDEYQAMAFDAGRDLIGTRAPELSFKTIDNQIVQLGQRNRPIYLKFWATWCVTCRAQMDAFKADHSRYGKDMDVVAVNTGVNDDRDTVEAYKRDVGLTMPVAIDDGRLAKAFHLKVTPQHVIIGRDGVIRYVGHLEDERLHRELEDAIAGKPLQHPRRTLAPTNDDFAGRIGGARVLTSVQGHPVEIDKPSQGKPRLLYFLSPWCETYLDESRPTVARECRETREALARASAAGKAQVIGIASGLSTNGDGVRRFIKRTGFNVPIVLDQDGALFRRFGIRSFPVVVRMDRASDASAHLTISEINALARQVHA